MDLIFITWMWPPDGLSEQVEDCRDVWRSLEIQTCMYIPEGQSPHRPGSIAGQPYEMPFSPSRTHSERRTASRVAPGLAHWPGFGILTMKNKSKGLRDGLWKATSFLCVLALCLAVPWFFLPGCTVLTSPVQNVLSGSGETVCITLLPASGLAHDTARQSSILTCAPRVPAPHSLHLSLLDCSVGSSLIDRLLLYNHFNFFLLLNFNEGEFARKLQKEKWSYSLWLAGTLWVKEMPKERLRNFARISEHRRGCKDLGTHCFKTLELCLCLSSE